MNLRIVGALVSKDFSLFFRNRMFAILTALGIIAYLAIYFVMPRSVNESLAIGLHAPVVPPVFEQIQKEGLKIEAVSSEEALKEAVARGQYAAGVALPADIMEALRSGQKPQIKVYFAADTPQELKDIVAVVVRELAYLQVGQAPTIEVVGEVLGPDMIGMQIPPRDRVRPLLAVFLIIAETFFLASLISEEVERRTIQALLVTPVTVRELFVAKGIVGVTLAFSQGALFMAAVGGMNVQTGVILAAMLLGAVLVAGVGFLVASVAKDFMSVLAWGIVALIPLITPAFGFLFPGTVTGWVRVVPSYYLMDTVHRASNFGSGWGDVGQGMLILLGFDLAVVWIGIIALRSRTR